MWTLMIAAAVLATLSMVVVKFWEDIASWLNTVAADAVEDALGYNARKNMHRAVAVVDRAMDKIRNVTTVYTKEDPLSRRMEKTTIQSDAYVSCVDREVLDEISAKGSLSQTYQYNH